MTTTDSVRTRQIQNRAELVNLMYNKNTQVWAFSVYRLALLFQVFATPNESVSFISAEIGSGC